MRAGQIRHDFCWCQVFRVPNCLCKLVRKRLLTKFNSLSKPLDQFVLHRLKSNYRAGSPSDMVLVQDLRVHLISTPVSASTSQLPTSTGSQLSQLWLEETASSFIHKVVWVPSDSHTHEADSVYNQHRSFLHAAFLYTDLRNAVRCEDGPRIISHSGAYAGFLKGGSKIYINGSALIKYALGERQSLTRTCT